MPSPAGCSRRGARSPVAAPARGRKPDRDDRSAPRGGSRACRARRRRGGRRHRCRDGRAGHGRSGAARGRVGEPRQPAARRPQPARWRAVGARAGRPPNAAETAGTEGEYAGCRLAHWAVEDGAGNRHRLGQGASPVRRPHRLVPGASSMAWPTSQASSTAARCWPRKPPGRRPAARVSMHRRRAGELAAMALIFAAETAKQVTGRLVQYHGGLACRSGARRPAASTAGPARTRCCRPPANAAGDRYVASGAALIADWWLTMDVPATSPTGRELRRRRSARSSPST